MMSENDEIGHVTISSEGELPPPKLVPIVIDYNITLEDIIAFNMFYSKESGEIRRLAIVGPLLFTLVGCLIAAVNMIIGKPFATFILVLNIILSSLIWVIFSPLIEAKRIRQKLTDAYQRKNDVFDIGPHTLSITSREVIEASGIMTISVRWTSVTEIIETEKYIYICYTNERLNAFVIPRSSFSTESSMESFLLLAKEFHASSM